MKKTDAISECNLDSARYGGVWHVVKLGPTEDDYYSVHSAWVQKNEEKPIYRAGKDETYDFGPPKRNVARTVIYHFNKFLLWLFKRFINARANNRKT